MKTVLPVTTLIVAFLWVGCVIIPTAEHAPRGRGSLDQERLGFIRTGATPKEEVLLSLGEPDMVRQREKIFAYVWVMVSGYWFYFIPGGYAPPAAGAGTFSNPHILLIEFDDAHVIKRFELKQLGVFSLRNLTDEIMRW